VRQGNLELIAEINNQKDENRALRNVVQAQIGHIRHIAQSGGSLHSSTMQNHTMGMIISQ
jgi:hypothetical protein